MNDLKLQNYLVIRVIWACRFICTAQRRDSFPCCEILFHMHIVAYKLKQSFHLSDVMIGPIVPREVDKLWVTDDEN